MARTKKAVAETKQETTKVEEKKENSKDKEVVVKSKVKLNKPKKQNIEVKKNSRSTILELGAGL